MPSTHAYYAPILKLGVIKDQDQVTTVHQDVLGQWAPIFPNPYMYGWSWLNYNEQGSSVTSSFSITQARNRLKFYFGMICSDT